MKVDSIIKFGHNSMLKYLHKGATVIDATIGNGNDTLFIKEHYPRIKVYGFDIQEQAIISSKLKNKDFDNIEYINDSHEHILKYVDEQIDLVIFNLGYLPNSNSNITTTSDSTINAIKSCIKLLKKRGGIVITIYTEHDNHSEEIKLLKYLTSLSKYEYNIIEYKFMLLRDSPYCIVIEKK